jgi:rhodanese-related sulfurtransferase
MIFSLMKTFTRSFVFLGLLILATSCAAGGPAAEASGSKTATVAGNAASDTSRLPASLSYEDLVQLLADKPDEVLLLDVRTLEEFNQGHIAGAVLSPYDALETMFKEQDKSRPIVLYCRSGNRSSIALRTLSRMGYTNVSDFGGINRWRGSFVRP